MGKAFFVCVNCHSATNKIPLPLSMLAEYLKSYHPTLSDGILCRYNSHSTNEYSNFTILFKYLGIGPT